MTKPIQMKSSITFIQSNGCKEIYYKEKYCGAFYDDGSALISIYNLPQYCVYLFECRVQYGDLKRGIYRRAGTMGYTVQAIQYMN